MNVLYARCSATSAKNLSCIIRIGHISSSAARLWLYIGTGTVLTVHLDYIAYVQY